MKRSKIDKYRQHSENDKHWSARRRFIKKHVKDYEGKALDKLLALSMVFSNHVFMGFRYDLELTDKVLEMAEGIDVGEMPSYELVPSAETKKRPHSIDEGEPPSKKAKTKYSARPRFEPLHFVSSSSGTGETDKKENEEEPEQQSNNVSHDNSLSSPSGFCETERNGCDSEPRKMANTKHSARPQFEPLHFVSRSSGTGETDKEENEQEPEQQSNNGSHDNSLSSPSGFCETERNGHDSEPEHSSKDVALEGASELGNSSEKTASDHTRVMDEEEEEEDYTTGCEAHNGEQILQDGQSDGLGGSGSPGGCDSLTEAKTSDGSVLTRVSEKKQRLISKLQSSLAVTLKDPAFENRSQNYSSILLQSFKASETHPEYIFVNLKDIPPSDLPKKKKIPSEGYACELRCQGVYISTGYASCKNCAKEHVSKLAVRLFKKTVEMRVVQRQYKQGFVNDIVVCKVNASQPKLPPALSNPEDKLPPLRQEDEELEKEIQGLQHLSEGNDNSEPSSGQLDQKGERKTKFGQLLVIDSGHFSPIILLNQTARFNEVSIEYKFTVISDEEQKCEVYLNDQYVAEGYGTLKTCKQMAAKEALAILKQTQCVVKTNIRMEGNADAISRNEIIDRSKGESGFQMIKEDNKGNQLLRKMGWTGGGLGKNGEGIAEPIKVQNKFNRKGLGMVKGNPYKPLNLQNLKEILLNYLGSGSGDDLYFSNDLSKKERKLIHELAAKYGLQSRSYGDGKSRFIIVRRKLEKEQIINQLLTEGRAGQFELINPQALQQQAITQQAS